MSVVIGVFHAAFLARFLGPELKGIAATITSTVAVSSIVISCGIHQAFPYYKKNDNSKEFLNKFCSNILMLYTVLFCVSLVALFVNSLGVVEKASLILTPVFAYEKIINYVFLVEASKKRNLVNLISSLIETLLLFVFLITINPNNIIMVVSISVSIALRALISTIKVGFVFTFKSLNLKYLLGLFKFGLLPMLALLLTGLNSRVDILMLNAYNVPAAYIGIYSVGVGLAEKALIIPDAIREILLGKLVKGKNLDEVARACRIGTFFSFCITIFVLLFGRIVIDVLFGEAYTSAYNITLISAAGTIFMVYIKMVSQYNIVYNKQKTNALLLLLSVVTNIVLNAILIPKIGIVGAAISTFVGHFISGISFLIFYSKVTKMSIGRIVLLQINDFDYLKSLFITSKKK